MGIIMVSGLLLLNVAISWWNCYVVGRSWDIIKHHGSGFEHLVLWSGAIQAAIGFSMPLIIGLSFVSVSFLTAGEEPTLTAEQGEVFLEGIFSLWYLLIIFPILSTGFIIWIHSVREAVKRRDFASIATAGWNTFANIHNFSNAASGIADAFGGIGKVFKDLKGNALVIAVLIAIVAVSLLGGIVLTASLIQRYRRAPAVEMASA